MPKYNLFFKPEIGIAYTYNDVWIYILLDTDVLLICWCTKYSVCVTNM